MTTEDQAAAYPTVDSAGVADGPVVIRDKPAHGTAEWMLTFAAVGHWQTAFFDTEDDARKAMDDPWLNRPGWNRQPRLWRLVDGRDS